MDCATCGVSDVSARSLWSVRCDCDADKDTDSDDVGDGGDGGDGDGAGIMTSRPPTASTRRKFGAMMSLLPRIYIFWPAECRRLLDALTFPRLTSVAGQNRLVSGEPWCITLRASLERLALPREFSGAGCFVSGVLQTYTNERATIIDADADDALVDWAILRRRSDVYLVVASLGGVGRPVRGVDAETSRLLASEGALDQFALVRADTLRRRISLRPPPRSAVYGATRLLLLFYVSASQLK